MNATRFRQHNDIPISPEPWTSSTPVTVHLLCKHSAIGGLLYTKVKKTRQYPFNPSNSTLRSHLHWQQSKCSNMYADPTESAVSAENHENLTRSMPQCLFRKRYPQKPRYKCRWWLILAGWSSGMLIRQESRLDSRFTQQTPKPFLIELDSLKDFDPKWDWIRFDSCDRELFYKLWWFSIY